MNEAKVGALLGRLALHPRRQDRLCVVRGRSVVVSFACDQDRAAVTEILRVQGYAVLSDLTVINNPIGEAGAHAG